MKDEEKRETIPWEVKDPKPGYPQCHSWEPGRVSPPGLSYVVTIAAGDGGRLPLAGAGWYLSIARPGGE